MNDLIKYNKDEKINEVNNILQCYLDNKLPDKFEIIIFDEWLTKSDNGSFKFVYSFLAMITDMEILGTYKVYHSHNEAELENIYHFERIINEPKE